MARSPGVRQSVRSVARPLALSACIPKALPALDISTVVSQAGRKDKGPGTQEGGGGSRDMQKVFGVVSLPARLRASRLASAGFRRDRRTFPPPRLPQLGDRVMQRSHGETGGVGTWSAKLQTSAMAAYASVASADVGGTASASCARNLDVENELGVARSSGLSASRSSDVDDVCHLCFSAVGPTASFMCAPILIG